MKPSETLVNELSQEFNRDPRIMMAFLFGSYAAGRAHANSKLT